ncbi:ribosomal RNA large subunit methyltransferase J [Mycena maculata]|uniref:rRNA methyltransferase 2, mitochondrial n=1 Tax=Mycena maculata TaxID=230809 RepID=A0AAD7HY83_9AGAR|nr:ribosomal RNA large subunit methyltransferase J [Mycena maculata]
MPFRPSPFLAYAKKPSSAVWLNRQARDPYVRLRSSPDITAAIAATSYRSRSAFKLLEMEEKWRFLNHSDVQVVLDLGCAPGGWSQVVAQQLGWDRPPRRKREPTTPYPAAGESDWSLSSSSTWSTQVEPGSPLDISDLETPLGRGTIIGVDLLRMTPMVGVQFLEADFLAADTEALIRAIIERRLGPHGKADVILCDMASNSMGNAFHDIESSLAICTSVFEFSQRHLRAAQSIGRQNSGVLLMKYFSHPLLHMFRKEHLEPRFNEVRSLKPNASRSESKEVYFLCRGWKG